jgi:hypothetical protein
MLPMLRLAGCATVCVAVIGLAGVANADVLILESRASGFMRGEELRDTQRLHVPAGGYVKILRPAGDTQDIRGPYDRLVRDITRGETLNEKIWNSIRERIAKETAATRGASTGATRGLKP